MVNQEPSDREYTERGLERAILAYNSVTNTQWMALGAIAFGSLAISALALFHR